MLPRSLYFVGAWAASLPLVAGLLCYHGCLVVRACVSATGLERWACVLGGCPRSRSSARSRGTPAVRGAASAAPLAASGSATRRRRARAGPFGVQRAGQLLCGRGFCRVRLRRARPYFGARHMSLDRLTQLQTRAVAAFEQLWLWHTESCTAPRRVAVEFNASATHLYQYRTLIRRCYGPRVEGSSADGVQAAAT